MWWTSEGLSTLGGFLYHLCARVHPSDVATCGGCLDCLAGLRTVVVGAVVWQCTEFCFLLVSGSGGSFGWMSICALQNRPA